MEKNNSIDLMIKQLRESHLFAGCPNCGEEFSLSKAELFDGTKKFPTSAESIKNELLLDLKERQTELNQRLKDLEKRKISADIGSEKKAIAVGIGKIMEKVLPYYKDFTIPLADCRFLAEPVDVIIFEGASKQNIKKLSFLEIKTGEAKLNPHQRMIKKAIENKNVRSEIIK